MSAEALERGNGSGLGGAQQVAESPATCSNLCCTRANSHKAWEPLARGVNTQQKAHSNVQALCAAGTKGEVRRKNPLVDPLTILSLA